MEFWSLLWLAQPCKHEIIKIVITTNLLLGISPLLVYHQLEILKKKFTCITGCLVQVGNGIELEAVGLLFEPTCGALVV